MNTADTGHLKTLNDAKKWANDFLGPLRAAFPDAEFCDSLPFPQTPSSLTTGKELLWCLSLTHTHIMGTITPSDTNKFEGEVPLYVPNVIITIKDLDNAVVKAVKGADKPKPRLGNGKAPFFAYVDTKSGPDVKSMVKRAQGYETESEAWFSTDLKPQVPVATPKIVSLTADHRVEMADDKGTGYVYLHVPMIRLPEGLAKVILCAINQAEKLSVKE